MEENKESDAGSVNLVQEDQVVKGEERTWNILNKYWEHIDKLLDKLIAWMLK